MQIVLRSFTRFIFLAGLIQLFFITSSCRQETVKYWDVYLPPELKETFYHLPGTYWMIEEKASGLYFDSLFVSSSSLAMEDVLHPGSKRPIGRREVLRVRVEWPFYGAYFIIKSESSMACIDRNSIGEPCHFITYEFFQNNTSKGKTRLYYYPTQVEEQGWPVRLTGLYEPHFRIDTIFNDYFANGLRFEQVRRVIIDSDLSFQNTSSIRYISPKAGIIRWHFPQFGIDWQVTRYRIVRGE